MSERTKSLKFRKKPVPAERVAHLRERIKDECKFQFLVWAEGTSLDAAGMWNGGEPVYRPAICAWEAWKAAWSLLSPNAQAGMPE